MTDQTLATLLFLSPIALLWIGMAAAELAKDFAEIRAKGGRK